MYDKTIFASNLKSLLKQHGYTYNDISKYLNVSISTVSSWCNAQKIPRMDKVEALSRLFSISKGELIEGDITNVKFDNAEYLSEFDDEFITFPVIGSIAAGYNGQAIEEETGETLDVPKSLLHGLPPTDFMVLKVHGNSMSPQLLNGDKVLIRRCTSVDSGSIAVLIYDDNDATVKKVNYRKGEDWLEMVPLNNEYAVKRIEGKELENCRVLGKVVNLIRNFD